MSSGVDVIVVGSGPNGLTAAAALASQGLRVRVLEASSELGGGVRSAELTLPGFVHDVCSAVHPMGSVSPVFSALQLEQHGLSWVRPDINLAHPFDIADAAQLLPSLQHTAELLGVDAQRYLKLMRPFVRGGASLYADILSPLAWPRHPWLMARLGYYGLRSVRKLSGLFESHRTRALLAGCAAHAVLPLEEYLTAAVALVFATAAHVRSWPVVSGGSSNIARALRSVGEQHGVEFQVNCPVASWAELPAARAYVFDLAPQQVADIAGGVLANDYVAALRRYRMGPGVFKLDWALSEAIPWRDARCVNAGTVHVGGSFEEIAAAERQAFRGEVPAQPFLIVAQQSALDAARAPAGQHTGYAYCHVPAGCDVDMTAAIERQMERFAPGFGQTILARHSRGPSAWQAYNPSYVGGAVTGGVADLRQFIARPALRWDPYSTPHPQVFLCSHSTPPGGGVHGMCGWHAARSVLRRVFGRRLVLPAPTNAA